MSDADDSTDRTRALSPVPFLVALVGCLVIAVFAYVYLREGSAGDLVVPTSIRVEAPDTLVVRADGPFDGTAVIVQVGYAIGDDEIFLELVVDIDDCADCSTTESVSATVTLPEVIDGRSVEPGTGRALIDCTTTDGVTACVAE